MTDEEYRPDPRQQFGEDAGEWQGPLWGEVVFAGLAGLMVAFGLWLWLMKRSLFALVAIPFLALSALAQDTPTPAADDADCHAPVPAEMRSRNLTGVQCAWAALRTMALRARHSRLADLCSRQWGPLWSPREIEAACQECGVALERVGPGDQAALFAFLEKHVTNGRRPCWIGVQHGRHAVLCVHFERGKRVRLLGNSQTPWVFEMSWDQFLAYGPDGLAFALPADGGATTVPKKTADAPKKSGAEKPADAPAPPAVTTPPAWPAQACPNGVCPAPTRPPGLFRRVFGR